MRVVIGEDLFLLREGPVKLLSAHGFDIVAAVATAPELLAALVDQRPDVGIVDVRLPPTHTDDGLRAALQARAQIPGLPVLPTRRRGFQLLRRLEQQLRFAVHRPGNPVASPRSHDVPRRDVDSRVDISVAGETAGSAPEHGLALTRVPVHLPARRAPLARVMRLDLLHPVGRLVLQPATSRPHPEPKMPRFSPALAPTCRPGFSRVIRNPSSRPALRFRPGCQWECCSTARFHTYRAWPQWSRSTACWAGVGMSRYRDMRTQYRTALTFPRR